MGSPLTLKNLDSDEYGWVVFILLSIVTPIAFFVGHIDYDMWQWGYPSTFNYDAFHRIPWIRMSILLSFVTLLSANARPVIVPGTYEFVFVILLITFMLIYPLDDYVNNYYAINSLVAVTIVHGFGFRTIRNFIKREEIAKEESDQEDYLRKSKHYKSIKKMISDNNLDRNVVIDILEKIGTEASLSLVSHEEVNARVYGLPIDENHWYFYVESPLHQLHGLLTSSWLLVVSKDTHEIIYNGSANDEG